MPPHRLHCYRRFCRGVNHDRIKGDNIFVIFRLLIDRITIRVHLSPQNLTRMQKM